MIWQDDQRHGTRQADIAAHILDTIPALCGNPALAANPRLVAVAEGVAAYMAGEDSGAECAPEPGRTADLMRRALEASGEMGLARRIVVCGSTIVHPATWLTANGQTVWIMDLALLQDGAANSLEIALFDRARATLDTFADVWDETCGRGVLGLKNLSIAARTVLGNDAANPSVRRFSAELQAHCGARLFHLTRLRNWKATPAIVGLHE